MRAQTSSAARRSLLSRPTLATATRLASTLPPSPALPSSSLAAAAAAHPLRSLLSETALALSHVGELTKTDSAWQRRLERALARLDERVEKERPRIVLGPARNAANAPKQAPSQLKREVTVYGAPLTGVDEVLLALLEDPLADDSTAVQRAAVEEMIVRPAKAEAVSIEYGSAPSPTASASDSALRLASSAPFLQTSPALELVYLPPSTSPAKALVSLLLAPAPVLVVDSLRLLSPLTHPSPGASHGGPAKADASVLQALLRHPNLKLVVNRIGGSGGRLTASSLATDGPTKAELSRFATDVGQLVGFEPDAMRRFAEPGVVTWVDVGLAAEGYAAWRRSGLATGARPEEKARELQEFTDKVVGSNVAALQFTLANPPTPSAASPTTEEAAVVPFLVDLALDAARFDLLAYDNHLQNRSLAAKALAANAAKLATQYFVKALAVPPKVGVITATAGHGDKGQAAQATAAGAERRVSEEVVGDVRSAVAVVLARFGWLGMAAKGRVDDVGQEVGDAIRIGWGGEGERLLIFQTGVLSVLQQSLGSSLNRALTNPPHPSLQSAVLVNDLPRLQPITPSLLLGPVQNRLGQLLSAQGGPVAILQLRAQNAVRAAYALAATSVGGAYAGWFAELASAEGALGVGALGAALGLRFGMARWEKAKRKFWLDFDRIQGGLEEDLQKNTHEIVSDALLARPRVAVEGMEALVVKRRSELERRVEEIERLRARLVTLPAVLSAQ